MVLNPARKVRSVQEANMYLAEDRILCLGIVAQNGRDYKLIHAPDAIAETDSVPNFIQLLRQRRRWINSTWFALEYVLRSHSYYLEQSSHTFLTKFLAFPFVMLITRINRINQYLLVSFYYVVLHILTFDLLVIFQSTIPNTFLYNTLLGIVPATYFAIVFYIYLSCLTLDVSKPKGPLGRKNQKSLYAASSLVGLF
jgi:cellulose synthase/poly-beta-1,6-N-acetylglucosamine synthase-like glycosyltransferase